MTAVQVAGLVVACLSTGVLAGWWVRGGADTVDLARMEAERDDALDRLPSAPVVPMRRHG